MATDLLADMLALKRTMDALPPPLLAVKLHPADLAHFRRGVVAADPHAVFGAPLVFVDSAATRGRYQCAYSRATVAEWRRAEWRRDLLRVLRDRLAALEAR